MLTVLAGPRAYAHIRTRGFAPADIDRVFGASGAAKWLAIAGLDKAIFADWLRDGRHPVHLFGTSVGAFKLAAAASAHPAQALDRLARAYIEQRYDDGVDADTIAQQMAPVIDAVAPPGAAAEVLSHPQLRLQVGTVRCLDAGLASSSTGRQKRAFARAFAANLRARARLGRLMQRVVFADARAPDPLVDTGAIDTHCVALSERNFRDALVASGSLPVYMHGVRDIDGAPAGVYRDGGLLDYHPIARCAPAGEGAARLVLYPHFFPALTEGWLDKALRWRAVDAARLADVVLLCPSPDFVRSLALGAVPDRRDFDTYRGRDDERMQLWDEAWRASEQLGERFLALARSGDIAAVVKPL